MSYTLFSNAAATSMPCRAVPLAIPANVVVIIAAAITAVNADPLLKTTQLPPPDHFHFSTLCVRCGAAVADDCCQTQLNMKCTMDQQQLAAVVTADQIKYTRKNHPQKNSLLVFGRLYCLLFNRRAAVCALYSLTSIQQKNPQLFYCFFNSIQLDSSSTITKDNGTERSDATLSDV